MTFSRTLAAALGLLAAASCTPTHDVLVRWTVDGDPATVACDDDEDARVQIRSRADAAQTSEEETFALAKCVDGETVVHAGAVASIRVQVLDGDDVIGESAPVDVRPALLGDGDAVDIDVRSMRGSLRARLLLAGRSCDVAGATTFDVTLARTSDGIETDIVADNVEVECQDGDAWFIDHRVAIGARYYLQATTTLDGAEWSTPEPSGAEILIKGRDTVVDVDLRRVD